MRIIARATLYAFVKNRVIPTHRKAVKGQLDAWFAEVSRVRWQSSAQLKQQYRSASIISAERVVFNLKGNDYRLIIAVDYTFGLVLIKWLGTHQEYDKVDAREVAYDERCYADQTG